MKYLFPLVFIFMMVLRPVMPVVNYVINYDEIVQNRCENKGKPQMSCNGKCYLAKELAKTTDPSPKQDHSNTMSTLWADAFINGEIVAVSHLKVPSAENHQLNPYLDCAYHFNFYSKKLRPPAV